MSVFLSMLVLAAPVEKPDLAMMDMKAVHGVEDSLASVLNESFLVALKNSGQFGNVVGGSDLRAMLDLEQQKQALGCGDDGCLAELGGALGVPYLFYASLAKVGSKYVMHYKVMAVEEAKVVVRGMKTAAGDDALLGMPQTLVDEAVATLFTNQPKQVSAPAAAAKVVPAKAKTAQPGKPIKWSRWVGVGLSVAGGGLAVVGRGNFNDAKTTYQDTKNPTTEDFGTYEEAANSANLLWVSGLSVAVIGAGLAVVAP